MEIARQIFPSTICRYVRSLGTLPVNSLIWDGGSIHDEVIAANKLLRGMLSFEPTFETKIGQR